jgi:hypothetical protein
MKKLFIAVMLLTLTSCYEPNVKRESTGYVIKAGSSPIKIITVDRCQYLFGDWSHATVLTHKGNCNNPIHKLKSE